MQVRTFIILVSLFLSSSVSYGQNNDLFVKVSPNGLAKSSSSSSKDSIEAWLIRLNPIKSEYIQIRGDLLKGDAATIGLIMFSDTFGQVNLSKVKRDGYEIWQGSLLGLPRGFGQISLVAKNGAILSGAVNVLGHFYEINSIGTSLFAIVERKLNRPK